MRIVGSVKEKAARQRDDEDDDLDLGSLAGWWEGRPFDNECY